MDEHLIPELILNLVEKFNTSVNQNEFYNLQKRLEIIRAYLDKALQNKKEISRKVAFKRK